ncbi:hypothetical protein [Qipengyuania sphaerica]|uniref:hypothetical protein n=1 Tax=Qipengyuania sphaerica TaxID=2867243 RepID=UPI001C8712CB|nr:hypothetical protein [Qipengyuania sphaerica]MBX7540324.1 hypothetical protein [Qipengyuania sphaerica]
MPQKVTIRTYNVGFGDCFLMTIHYDDQSAKHILIDCGSMKSPKGTRGWMEKVVESIRDECGGKLDVLVATHRHKDHISAFSSDSTGSILEDLKPEVVIQPWTEDPDIPEDAHAPLATGARHRRRLALMGQFAENRFDDGNIKALNHLKSVDRATVEKLEFMGADNIRNRKAVERLMRMGAAGRAIFAHAKMELDLDRVLPGVAVDALGPPTIEQSEDVTRMRSRDDVEFWHINAASSALYKGDPVDPFPSVAGSRGRRDMFWIRHRLKRLELSRLFQIVRILDDTMNNTSLILLFRIGSKSFLFPGDAQIENWRFALNDPEVMDKLKDVDVYKVGHHGSLNATPRTLWEHFANKGGKRKRNRLTTLLSTLDGKHGHVERKTEVPRRTLVNALEKSSNLVHTQELPGVPLFEKSEFEL